jgi:hypothetical protein
MEEVGSGDDSVYRKRRVFFLENGKEDLFGTSRHGVFLTYTDQRVFTRIKGTMWIRLRLRCGRAVIVVRGKIRFSVNPRV